MQNPTIDLTAVLPTVAKRLSDDDRRIALKGLAQLKQDLHPLREELLAHPIYKSIDSVEKLTHLMEHHVFAVWDFMSIVKRLQRGLTCVNGPWVPPAHPIVSRFINDVVLTEESDVGPAGDPMSHLEIYLRGMVEVGASTSAISQVLKHVSEGMCAPQALRQSGVPAPAARFATKTFDLVDNGELVEVAAVFSCGREDIIPEMFEEFLGASERRLQHAVHFRYYLERHIHLDAEEHGPMAEEMLLVLAGTDRSQWQRATTAAAAALRQRLELWDAIALELSEAAHTAPNAGRRRALPVFNARAS